MGGWGRSKKKSAMVFPSGIGICHGGITMLVVIWVNLNYHAMGVTTMY